MRYALTPSSLPPARTVSRQAELTPTGVADAATRLRSWALIIGEQVTGLPFLRISGELHCEVHVPVAGRVHPHPQTGVSAEMGDGGLAVALRTVRFEELRTVMRELNGEIAADCGLAGPVEFHPSTAEFHHGTVVWPVHKIAPELARQHSPQLVEVGA